MIKDKLKILIISHRFPPLNTMGSLRPYFWAKYWARIGYDVCVLTFKKESFDGPLNLQIDPDEMRAVRIEEIPYWRSIRKYSIDQGKSFKNIHRDSKSIKTPLLLKLIKILVKNIRKLTGMRLYNDYLWALPAYRRAFEIYREWPFNVIVSSYGPAASHIIAGILKRKLNVFWVADYRDLWYENHFCSVKWPFSYLDKIMEDFFVKKADLFTTVSDPLKEKLASRFGYKAITIENGFDVEELDKIEKKDFFPQDGKIRLVYTGSLHKEKQNPLPLFKAINILKNRGLSVDKKLEIILYGVDISSLMDMIIQNNLGNIVKTPGFVDRKTALQAQRNADLLIFLDWEDSSVDGIITGKLFEYMFSGKPVLCIGKNYHTIASRLIEDAGIGFVVGDFDEKIADVLETLIKVKKLNYSPSKEVLSKYTRKRLAEKMLKEIVNRLV